MNEELKPVVKNTILGLRVFHGFIFLLYTCSLVLVLILGYASYQDSVTYYNAGTSINSTINALQHQYISKSVPSNPTTTVIVFGIFAAVLLVFIFLYFIGLLTAHVRSKVNWVFQLILCIISTSGLLTLIPAALLIVGLVSNETRDYYFNKPENV